VNIKRHITLITATLFAAACAASGPPATTVDIDETELLSGTVIFGGSIDTSHIPDPGIFEVDDDMRAFIAEHVDSSRASRERMRRLLAGMISTGLMSLDYNDATTKTARQTFHDRVGNCISFTALFVALARETNLDVKFQTVEIPPIWYADSGLVILNNHVNARVKHNFGIEVVVDFNIMELKGDYETQIVSDEYALALYYNNVAMDALRAGDQEQSFRLLKKSIETYPNIAANWANLGVIYSRSGWDDYAIAAHLKALELDKDHRPSMANLAFLYQGLGDPDTAESYRRKIRRYQDQNPYFHYSHALAAYNNGDMVGASERLGHAMRLKDSEHKFYQLQGLIAAQQGDADLALRSIRKARSLAVYSDAQRMYDTKIQMLTSRR
jgi:Flp pilus assembly protein TadD